MKTPTVPNVARRVVEIGTSHGVSTLIWPPRCASSTEKAVVIGTEYKPAQAMAARFEFAEAGLGRFVHLLKRNLRQTLKEIEGPIDVMLTSGSPWRLWRSSWSRNIRACAVIVCDNTDAYADYFAFIDDPANRRRAITLPRRWRAGDVGAHGCA